MDTKNPYVNLPMSHSSNPAASKDSALGTGGNQKNLRILQQFQESNRNQNYYGSDLSSHQSKEKGVVPSQYRPQHQPLSSKY